MSRPIILLIGANGQVGHALQTTLRTIGEVVLCTRAELDLSQIDKQPHLVFDLVQKIRPHVIVNAAAYTAVDKAESDQEHARTINAVVPGLFAQAAQRIGACMVHYSTDYVFDGSQAGRYREQDPTQPSSVYGQTKLEGERAVARACPRHLILRTSWVVSAHGGNFLKTMLKAGQERESLRVVADQFGAPTSAVLIAQTTAHMLHAIVSQPATDPRWGVYHLVASGATNWFDYAQYVLNRARELGWPIKVAPLAIEAIATADFPVAAKRPQNSKLDTSKLCQAFDVVLPDWTVGVDEVLALLTAQRHAAEQNRPPSSMPAASDAQDANAAQDANPGAS